MNICQTKIILAIVGLIALALVFMQVPPENRETLSVIVTGLFALARSNPGPADKP